MQGKRENALRRKHILYVKEEKKQDYPLTQ